MRKKLILLLLLMLTIALTLVNMNNNRRIVDDPERIQLFNMDNFEQVDNILKNNFREDTIVLADVTQKYEEVDGSQLRACDIDAIATLITRVNNYNVIVLEDEGKYEYFRQFNNNSCELIGSISDVNFTQNIDEAYANNSIYTSFVSNSDFSISGMVRIKDDTVIPFDTLDARYINPVAFNDGVLMILNKRDIVAFNNEDEIIFRQDNAGTNRQVISFSVVNNHLIAIVDIDDQYFLEAYALDNIENLEEGIPLVSFDITGNLGQVGSEISTIIGDNYTSFTTIDNTIIVSSDLSKVIVLNNFNTALGFSGNYFIGRQNEGYYIFDLDRLRVEVMGNVRVLNFRIIDRSIIYQVLNTDGQILYIKFSR